MRWALSGGLPLHRDALAAVLDHHACRYSGGSYAGGGPDVVLRWTCEDVLAATSAELVTNWCAERGVIRPPEVLATLGTYLDYLGHFRLLARGSDPLAAMRAVLHDVAADRPPASGRLGHPAGGGRVVVLPQRG